MTEAGSPGTLPVLSDIARMWEPDRYFAALLAQPKHRHKLIALAAFLADLRKLPYTVSDPMLAAIRLQWWRDTVESQTTSGYPVADTFTEVCRTGAIDLRIIQDLIDAEETLWEQPDPLGAVTDREKLAFQIAAELIGQPLDAELLSFTDIASELYAITRSPTSPMDATKKAQSAAQFEPMTKQFRILPPALRNIFLPLAVVRPHLRGLQTEQTETSQNVHVLTPFGRAWRIARAHYFQRM